MIRRVFVFVLRMLVRLRLTRLPLSMAQAEWWGDYIRKTPGYFDCNDFAIAKQVGHGLVVRVGVVDHIERHLRIAGTWDTPVEDAVIAWLRPGDTFLDIGANIGYFTMVASRIVGSAGIVVACEPSKRALGKLLAALVANRCDNVIVLSIAAGDHDGLAELGLANEGNIGGSSLVPDAGIAAFERIAVMRVGPLLERQLIRPALIKIDVEGFELRVLRGLTGILDHRPAIICEVTERYLARGGQTVGAVFDHLSALGYAAYELTPGESGQTRCRPVTADRISGQCEVVFCVGEPRLVLAQDEPYG